MAQEPTLAEAVSRPVAFPPPLAPAGPPAGEQEPTTAGLPETFPEGHRAAFTGIMLLGKLQHGFDLLGHRIEIRTLRGAELVEVARVVARYAATDGYVRAYSAAICAACVITADGQPLPGVPLTLEQSAIEVNYAWVQDHWFPPVQDRVYEQYVLLEVKVREIMDAMGKASG